LLRASSPRKEPRGKLSFGSYPRATTHFCVSSLGAIAKRCASALLRSVVRHFASPTANNLHAPSTQYTCTTEQRISTDTRCTGFHCRVSPTLTLRASLPASAAPTLRVEHLGLVAAGRWQSALQADARRSPSPLTPWLAASGGPPAAGAIVAAYTFIAVLFSSWPAL
jgi:hypothetical protein